MEACILKLNEIGAIKFGDYILKSGLRSPIYIDLRMLIAYPKFLENVADMMWKLASDDNYDQICGVPYTALPIATIISLKQNIPMLIKRKEQKNYGTKKQLEGLWKNKDACLMIEDVTVSGSSVMETIEVLKKENINVKQTIVFIDRQQGGLSNLKREGVNVKAVYTLDDVVNVLLNKGKINHEVAENTREFIRSNNNVPLNYSSENLSSKSKIVCPRKLPLMNRMELVEHPVIKRLFNIMHDKKTNLCVAADVCLAEDLLQIVDKVGPHICILKTHIDILENFTPELKDQLKRKAKEYNFLIMEDRKFADIGKTVQNQYAQGMYKIAQFADIVTVHGVSGYGVITGIQSVANNCQACVLIAEMSSEGNLCQDTYKKACVSMAKRYPEFVIGFVAQSDLTSDASHIVMTPGVSMVSTADSLGQQYKTPADAIQNGSDIIIVGRSVISDNDVELAAKKYKEICYSLFVDSRNM